MTAYHDGGWGRTWPGLSVPSGRIRMDPAALITAADELRFEWRSLTGGSAGSLPHFGSATAQPDGVGFFGGWDVAQDMAGGYRVAQQAFEMAYQRLVDELDKAVVLLCDNADDTRATDRRVAAAMPDQPGALGVTGPWVEVREA